MIILLTGGCKNGKSGLAQKLAVFLSDRKNGQRYYVATMKSTGAEDDERIRRHVEDRKGLGFTTLEIKERIHELPEHAGSATYLVDSITALLANEMFREKDSEFYTDKDAADRVAENLVELLQGAKARGDDLIFVSDGIYSDAAVYNGDTYLYRKGLGRLERVIAEASDLTIEMCAGAPIIHCMSAEAEGDAELMDMINRDSKGQGVLIVGGASQGKRAFVKEKFGLKDDDFYTFKRDDEVIPFGYKAYEHVERLVWEGRHGIHELADDLPREAVLICEDITCGIVPMSSEDRRWRDDVGRLMQELGADREIYRVICGKGTRIG